jgi:hypothetical protein
MGTPLVMARLPGWILPTPFVKSVESCVLWPADIEDGSAWKELIVGKGNTSMGAVAAPVAAPIVTKHERVVVPGEPTVKLMLFVLLPAVIEPF